MSSARNTAQLLTVKTELGSCASPKFDVPSSDCFQGRLLFWRGTARQSQKTLQPLALAMGVVLDLVPPVGAVQNRRDRDQ